MLNKIICSLWVCNWIITFFPNLNHIVVLLFHFYSFWANNYDTLFFSSVLEWDLVSFFSPM